MYPVRPNQPVSIVLPTYNERENLPIIVGLIDQCIHKMGYEIIIVDDGSPDGTLEIAEGLRREYGEDKIVLAPRKGKLGLGTAYVHGAERAKYPMLVLMDADLSHHPKFIPRMVEKMKRLEADIVSGTRYCPRGAKPGDVGVYGWNFKRRLISSGANYIAKTLLRPPISDLTGSFRVYRKEVFMDLVASGTPSGYAFQMGAAVKAGDLGYKLTEVPITFVDRIYGESKLGMKEIIIYGKAILHFFCYNPNGLARSKKEAMPAKRKYARVWEVAAVLGAFLLAWQLLLAVWPQAYSNFVFDYLPVWAFLLFGIYSAFSVLHSTVTFLQASEEANQELLTQVKQIKEAKKLG